MLMSAPGMSYAVSEGKNTCHPSSRALRSSIACRENGTFRTWEASSLKSHLLSLFVLMVLTAFVANRPIGAQSTSEGDVRELERLETVWNEAHEHGDADALERLWADDIEIAVPKMPVLKKADAFKFARSGRMKFLSYQTSDIRVRVYDNTAVVTGRLQRTRSLNGQEMSDDWRFTKTYVREAQRWRVVAFHASEAAQP